MGIKIIYFPFKGRAEPVRLALTIAGIDFEDTRVTGEEFAKMKADGVLPFGQFPIIEVDGKPLAQSVAQLIYAGRLAGLIPSDTWEEAKVMEFQMGIEDIVTAMIPALMEKDEAKKMEMKKELADVTFPKWFGYMEKLAGDGGYAVGSKLTIADLSLYNLMSWLKDGIVGIPKDMFDHGKHTKLNKVFATVDGHEKVKAWNAAVNEPKKQTPH
ncbi:unnamed protein product [Vitrella brassicaformis CCMP3155]|uniref:Glutathione S-transferase n=1 Tax=Vitrella brassicaformis (strain CCMP3155) TaxID=1169540 RepID=A0A0G4GKH4_VITBC|nr:unnamed protein product [Vitrella brassicaformis CCMP3155]|mmetsp:Transcript_24024/g.59373  ORF Transcript_24024/g.59373 Transcript_24024/m.59373 type:complete len:213 (-) Transcript_24024:478-1116(-)|eukprot:CEM30532.1 unnamed protein product [Vitrella brassicaformis CCMP3155]